MTFQDRVDTPQIIHKILYQDYLTEIHTLQQRIETPDRIPCQKAKFHGDTGILRNYQSGFIAENIIRGCQVEWIL